MKLTSRKLAKRLWTTLFIMTMAAFTTAQAQNISGTLTDEKTGNPMVGVLVQAEGTDIRTTSDSQGHFLIKGIKADSCTLLFKYAGYQVARVTGTKDSPLVDGLKVAMQTEEQKIGSVSITGTRKKNTETAAVQTLNKSQEIVSNVSAQEISKTQDNNAGEVIRRVPGISLIDDKFVMVRGLSQRYNNVWINGSAVPSSEADNHYMPQAGSPVLSYGFTNPGSAFTQVSFVGAFNSTDDWTSGWANWDPQNTNY